MFKSSHKRNVVLASLAFLLIFSTVLPYAANAWSITIRIGKATKGCSGVGICSVVIDLRSNTQDAGERAIIGNGELKDNLMIVSITKPAGKTMSSFPVTENFTLSQEDAKLLGFKKVTILKGDYAIDNADGTLGTIAFKVKTEGKIKSPRDAASGLPTGKRS